ncbi:MAG TPA: DUF5666 domain-containing protein [Ramlibacter sp.]|uniref:DUF5666 domain-containing protein n=1 Tax=Ramlibacter sp. TaxID=1917967 RepID=UPI002ED0D34C
MSDPRISRVVPPRIPRRRALVTLLSMAGVVVLPSCGGGGGGGGGGVVGGGGVDTGGTGSFMAGRISGFGSIIVNGVRFDDRAARVVDEDDDGRAMGPGDLRLGMVVRVLAGATTAGTGGGLPTATATAITIESEIKGPVESKTAPDTLVVFGQTVKVDAATVFDGTTFAAIAVGNILEVSGFLGANGVVTATRIERENAANEFKVRGFIADLDPVAQTFRIGTAIFNFASAARLPATPLANGQFVRVRTQTVRNAAGQWVVNRIDLRQAVEQDRDEAEVEGILVQNGALLQVNGITIDVSRLPAGTVLPIGQRVEIEGELVNGVLVAREIELEDEDEEAEVDVEGAVSALNLAAQTFVVRGLTFHYSAATRLDDGTIEANLANGVVVRVKGRVPAGGTGPIEATEIDFTP